MATVDYNHPEPTLDKHRPGYPRYTALLSTHPSFQTFRRFTRVRMRILLQKQDEISRLEETLDGLDAQESREIFLGCMRRDVNPERLGILQQLKTALSEYDELVAQSGHILSRPDPRKRDVDNLKTWTSGTGCISRQETRYLEMDNDLANITGPTDIAITYFESIVEDCTLQVDSILKKYRPGLRSKLYRITSDEHVLLLGPFLRAFSRALIIFTATMVIIAPSFFLPNVESLAGRLACSTVSASVFLLVVSFLTKASTKDIFTSGASYTAVLVALTTVNTVCPTSCA